MSLLIAVALMGADPVVEPWNFEARVATLEAKVEALEKRCANCCCATNASPAAVAAPVQYVQSCQNGVCQMVPAQGGPQFAPSFSGCANGQCGMQSSGGGCANGQCGGSSGGRGFHPFRRGR